MTTQAQPQEDVKPIPPKCPYCEKEFLLVGIYAYQIGNLVIISVFCPWCHVQLHMHIPQKQETVPASDPPDKSPLWKPS